MAPADSRSAATEDLARTGGHNAPVKIVEYDPAWPAAYETERERLASLLPAGVLLHHFGSTAVPGLAAKPVIDMIALVDDFEVPIAALGRAGLPPEVEHHPLRRPTGSSGLGMAEWRRRPGEWSRQRGPADQAWLGSIGVPIHVHVAVV